MRFWIRAASAGALLVAAGAAAQLAPLPSWVRSAAPRRDQVTVYGAPDARAPRRGAVLRSARLPVRARVPGAGDCAAFVRIGPEAYVCERDVELSDAAPGAAPLVSASSDLPYEYLQVVADGTRGYATPSDYFADEYATLFGAGFSLAVATRARHQGVSFVRTRSGHYVLERALRPVRASDFAGVRLESGGLARVGWVTAQGARVTDEHTGDFVRTAGRLERVDIDRVRKDGALVLAGGMVIDAAAVRRPRLQPPPPEIRDGERWIDVDLERQVLVAYEGRVPHYATLISSGKETQATRTPRGAFRIWVKLLSSDMRDREAHELERGYALEQVPWVQYFKQGYGLHAAFWHDRFGEPYSRGCINLAPRDARYLFAFTAPALPPGWFAVRPTAADPGTLVVVR